MAKPKKEFKARVRKVQKHIVALLDLAVSTQQREALYRIQKEADFLEQTLEQEFEAAEESPDVGDRRGPLPVAG